MSTKEHHLLALLPCAALISGLFYALHPCLKSSCQPLSLTKAFLINQPIFASKNFSIGQDNKKEHAEFYHKA
jgi:hypothetical protein